MEFLKGIGQVVLSVGAVIALFFALYSFIAFGVAVGFVVGPVISWVAGILFLFDLVLLIFTPIPSLRNRLGVVIFISSYIFGIGAWLYGLTITFTLWGIIPLLIGLALFGVGVVPFGLFAAALTGHWGIFWTLLFTIGLTYGARLIGALLVTNSEAQKNALLTAPLQIAQSNEKATPKRSWKDVE